MSDSAMPWKPRMEEPSKSWPLTKKSSSIALAGRLKCCCTPGMSVNRMSTKTTSSFLMKSRTSWGLVNMRTAPCLIECGGGIVTRRDTSTCLSSVGFGRITNHPDISSIVGIFFGCMTNVFRQCYKFGKQVTSLVFLCLIFRARWQRNATGNNDPGYDEGPDPPRGEVGA